MFVACNPVRESSTTCIPWVKRSPRATNPTDVACWGPEEWLPVFADKAAPRFRAYAETLHRDRPCSTRGA